MQDLELSALSLIFAKILDWGQCHALYVVLKRKSADRFLVIFLQKFAQLRFRILFIPLIYNFSVTC